MTHNTIHVQCIVLEYIYDVSGKPFVLSAYAYHTFIKYAFIK